MILADSDNAMGSRFGDVDDGFALSLLLEEPRLVALSSVAGNTSELQAYRNNETLAKLTRFPGTCLRGSQVGDFLLQSEQNILFLALGPLTNLANAILMNPLIEKKIDEVVIVGSNFTSKGKWPPIWPFEFNLSKDKEALRVVFESTVPLTFIPLDLACQFRASAKDVMDLGSPLGKFLWKHSKRWFRRARWLKGQGTIPLWDVLASLYLIRTELFSAMKTSARLHPNGWIEYRRGTRAVTVITDFNRKDSWEEFKRRLN